MSGTRQTKDGLLLGEEIAGVNQILPHKHKSAWDLFLKGVANNWSPAEINMTEDVNQWKGGKVSKEEKCGVMEENNFFEHICCMTLWAEGSSQVYLRTVSISYLKILGYVQEE